MTQTIKKTAKIIIIPTNTGNYHWVTAVHRQEEKVVSLYYADSLYDARVEGEVRRLLSNTTNEMTWFFPKEAKWYLCQLITRMPHGNECRAIMALYLDPNKYRLVDLKDAHMGKHARELMAVTIIKGIFNSTAIESYLR